MTRFQDWDVRVLAAYYGADEDGFAPRALQLFDVEDGSPIATLTHNVPGVELTDNQILVKDTAENAGSVEWLGENDIATPVRTGFPVGHYTAGFWVCELTEAGRALWDDVVPPSIERTVEGARSLMGMFAGLGFTEVTLSGPTAEDREAANRPVVRPDQVAEKHDVFPIEAGDRLARFVSRVKALCLECDVHIPPANLEDTFVLNIGTRMVHFDGSFGSSGNLHFDGYTRLGDVDYRIIYDERTSTTEVFEAAAYAAWEDRPLEGY